MQMENVQKSQLDICAYYKKLSKKDKKDLITYLVKRYDMNYYTICSKFNKRSKMNQLEIETIANIINEESWRI